MVKKKSEEKKEKPSPKKINKLPEVKIDIEKYSISELLEVNKIKPLDAVGFLKYYGLTEDFRKEIEDKEVVREFSKGEFADMYERYMKRGI